MTPRKQCPNCGREYEPEYENREDAPPLSIGREQHQTGICSDECWDQWMDATRADGGSVTEKPEPGDLVVDREEAPDRQTPMVVVKHRAKTAREHTVPGMDATVYFLNKRYGYAPDSNVVDVAYIPDMDDASRRWRQVDPNGLPELVRQHDVRTYSFPVPRLERIEDDEPNGEDGEELVTDGGTIEHVLDGSKRATLTRFDAEEGRVDVPISEHQRLVDGAMEFTLERDRGNYRNGPSARAKLDFCIRQLEDAETFAAPVGWQTGLVAGLSVEEVVGTLLHARDELARYEGGEYE